ncbi:MAG TPA: hypothetical protein VM306_12145 [Lentzea sp.]|nr:hypothetical protein [Lentzea sp.]HUQ56392.1 hypothetical protein [Lentzea sp.]
MTITASTELSLRPVAVSVPTRKPPLPRRRACSTATAEKSTPMSRHPVRRAISDP